MIEREKGFKKQALFTLLGIVVSNDISKSL